MITGANAHFLVVLIGLFPLGYGFYLLRRSVQLRRKGVATIGTVTRVKWAGRFSNMDVEFKAARNRRVVFRAGGRTANGISPYRVGNQVPVLYDPDNRRNAVIATFYFMWMLPLADVVVGIGFIAMGLFTH